ncbi:hypothetical protein TNCV_4674991 [Trichonephila clavipes]|nr:hypothetical protein TNCV_4674991 [Trichonephila clavipes]
MRKFAPHPIRNGNKAWEFTPIGMSSILNIRNVFRMLRIIRLELNNDFDVLCSKSRGWLRQRWGYGHELVTVVSRMQTQVSLKTCRVGELVHVKSVEAVPLV